MNSDEAMLAIVKLSKKMRHSFDQLCCNQKAHSNNLKRLAELGLAESYEETLHSWPHPIVVTRYRVSIAVHIAWAELCSREMT